MHSFLPYKGVRIASLDAWRGLAAIMVVALHVMGPAVLGPYPELGKSLLYKNISFGNYGVQIFFVVSGFCIAQAALRSLKQTSPISNFIVARIRRIYPPYAVVSILGILMSGFAAYLVQRHVLPGSSLAAERLFARPAQDYACSVLMLQHVCRVEPLLPVFWTLCYEVAFYALVAGALLIAARFRRDHLLPDLCHGLTLVCCISLVIAPARVPYPFDLWPEFGLGILVLDIFSLRRRTAYVVLLGTVVLQIAYATKHLAGGANFTGSAGMGTFVAVAFCLFLLAVEPFDERLAKLLPVRVLAYVGAFSYSLYLVHWLVIGIVSQVMKRLYAVSAETYWISALAQIITAVLAAKLFYKVAEQPFLYRRPVPEFAGERIRTFKFFPSPLRRRPVYEKVAGPDLGKAA